ncbi:hypothetical protein N7467_002877 [Penicillium canescens]|nr:hypothetical protein N7467_002877 [Penicillium canescens]
MEEDGENLINNLLDLQTVISLKKKVSLSSNLLRPFLQFRRILSVDRDMVWAIFSDITECIITLQSEHAQSLGLFGNGEGTVQFVDPFDRAAVLQYQEPWKRTVDEDTESVADFLLRVENVRRYRFQVRRWLAEMLMAYIGFNWMLREEATNPHLPGLQTALRMLYEDPANRLDPVVQQYLAKFPKVHVRVLFR